MKDDPFILIKFFAKREYAEALLDGRIFANTPAFYRTTAAPGVGDPYESVVIDVKPDQAADFVFMIDDRPIEGITGFTFRREPDQYLHCWMSFKKPNDADGFNQLSKDIDRIRGEFGGDYIILLPQDIGEYANRLSKAAGIDVQSGHVAYSDDPLEQSPRCKRASYAYQREYRFLLGECGNKNVHPKEFRYEQGFRDILHHNAELKLTHKETGENFLRLAGANQYEKMDVGTE